MHHRSWLLLTVLLSAAVLMGGIAGPGPAAAQSATKSASAGKAAAEVQYPPWTPDFYSNLFYAVSGPHDILEKDAKRVILFASPRNIKIDLVEKTVEGWDAKGQKVDPANLKVGDRVTAAWRDDHVVFLVPPYAAAGSLPEK